MASASSTPRSKGNDEVSRTSSPTPRTKIKALLATVDSDSDSKASPSAKEASHSDKAPSKPATSRENHDVAPDASSSGEDTDEEALFRPRGLAARMRVANSGPERQTGTTDAEESARDRVRRLLQLGNSSPEAVDKSPRQPAPQGHEDALRDRPEPRPTADSDEDDDVVGATRARTTRRARPAASSSPQSERLFVSPTKSDAADAEGGAEVIIADVDADADADGETDSDDDVAGMSATGGQLVKKKDRFLALVARKRREREEAEAEAARQEAERRERLEQQLLSEAVGSDMDADDDIRDISDDEGGRRLTQDVLARPAARKASKKALEEMNRETQRMSRSLQLAHEAKTKKKITKAALFERFNYRPQGVAVPAPAPVAEEAVAATSSSRPVTPRSAGHSDTEARDCDTPPSSPPLETAKEEDRFVMSGALPVTGTDGEGATDRPSLDAGESKDVPTATSKEKEADAVSAPEAEKKDTTTVARPAKRQFRVKLPILNANLARTDADDELEITVPKKSKLDAIFDSVPAQDREESRSLLALRRLAHLSSPPREGGGSKNRAAGGGRTSMTPGELQALLRLRAREQAREERERRLEMLRAKGVVLQTEEERERELAEVEDIVARARREAEEIMRREAEAAKKEKKAAGEDDDPLALDDSDDESYEEAAPELKEVELSGSEEEAVDDEDEEENEDEDEDGDDEDEEMEDAGDEANEALPGGLYDDEADETDADDEDATNEGEKGEAADAEEGSDEDSGPVAAPARSRNRRRHTSHAKVVSDDEDEDAVQVEATPRPPSKGCFKSPPQAGVHTDSPRAPTSVLRSATKPFIPGLPVMGAAGLGLTQIFQGTMDDSQAGSGPRPTASSEVMMPDFDAFPSNNLSTPSAAVVPDSQRDGQRVQVAATPGEGRSTENAPVPMFGSPFVRDFLNAGTQSSEFIEATQDVGFQARSPMKERFIIPPASTVGTVVADSQPAEQHDSPLVQRKGKLRRKTDVAADIIEQADSDDGLEGDELPVNSTSAFSVMKEAAKKPKSVVQFDKKKSTAKEMVEDEAEESEDEYAGLGGVDGEDSSEDEGSVKDMIDDKDAGKVLDERKIAAFHADRERASDEKQVEKLFRDITTGMLRRKRGADFDLSDSDDGGEARRRMKRRQFAKMQKALFADERIEKIAENPRNLAFLRSIEDRDDDDEPGILDDIFPSTVRSGSESQEQDDADFVVPDSQPDGAAVSGKGKTKAPLNPRPANGVVAERLPANQRRTKDGKRPSNLSEVRESLSTLLDESSMASLIDAVPDTDLSSSDDEGDGSEDADADDEYPGRKSNDGSPRSVRGRDKENRSPAKLRRPTGTGRVEKPTRVSPQKMGSQHGANVRRHGVTAVKATIIDRISLKRRDSSMSSDSASASTGGRMAFGAAPSTGAGSAAAAAFKVPALLRRVTTSSLLSNGSGSSSSTSQSASGSGAAKKDGSGNGFGDDARLKRTASKRSGVNYFAREIERRAALAEKEKRREARKWKGAEGRLAVVGGLFGKGTFE